MSPVRSLCAWMGCAAFALDQGLRLARARLRRSDLLITAAKPDRLFVIDAATRSVRAEHHVAGADGQIFTIVMSPDQRIAYLLVAKMERIVGIELASGREVFRADLSTPRNGSRISSP